MLNEYLATGFTPVRLEVEIDVDEQKIRQIALDAITAKQEQIRAATEIETSKLETRKQNLLALTAPGAE